MSCGGGHRRGSDPFLLWLWCRPAATVSIVSLAWEPPYATGVAPRKQKKKKKNPQSSNFSKVYGLKKNTNVYTEKNTSKPSQPRDQG